MAERQWAMQRGSAAVWQRLPHGPAPKRGGRAQARRARRGRARPIVGALASATLVHAATAGWARV
jgi:hypothetical protein